MLGNVQLVQLRPYLAADVSQLLV